MYTYSRETFRGLLSFRKVFTKWNPVERFVAVAADGNARNDRATPRSLSLSPAPRIFLQGPEEFAECRRRSSSSAAGVSGRAASEPHGRKTFWNRKIRYPLCVLATWIFLSRKGGDGRGRKRETGRTSELEKRRLYDIWKAKSNFRSFVNFVWAKRYEAKRILLHRGMKFFRYPRKLNSGRGWRGVERADGRCGERRRVEQFRPSSLFVSTH